MTFTFQEAATKYVRLLLTDVLGRTTTVEHNVVVSPEPPPPPPAPTASFTYSPASPQVGEPVEFDATDSACPDGPCVYEWSDDGGPTRPTSVLWPLGGGQTMTFTFHEAATKYVRLLLTDVLGRTTTVEHDVTVEPEPPPPPPTAPSNITVPTVSGTAQVGQTLTAHNGTWSGTTPITYTHQWQREGANIAGATGSTYTPVTADVAHTLDVAVTAHNTVGSESATSAQTAAIAKEGVPPAPTASFTHSPVSPEEGQSVEFDATASTCSDSPCTYEWSNDGGPVQPIPPQFPLGSGQTISMTFTSAGTKYIRLLVTDLLGRTATVEHNVTVEPEPPPPPPPTAPSNTAVPTVSGAAQVGQTLTAHNGTWSGTAPITFTHQWQREGANIAGATGSTYTPVTADVAHTLDVGVTAHNTAGSESATSAPTAAVTKEESSGQQTNCIAKPSSCGYPDATNTGVPAGTTLTHRSGEVSVTAAGTTVKDLAVTGEILVEADNTTVEDDEVTASAGSGNRGIYIAPGVTGTVIDHVTCHGEGKGSQYCVFNKNSSTKIEHSYLYNCGECLNGPGTITNSFFDVTAVISGEHYEDIYYGGGEGSLIVNHDTMLNPQGQTATVFASNDFGDQNTLTITNNLLAGGGYTLYGGASCTTGECGAVKGPVTVSGNRFSNTYYPESGYYGIGAYFNNAVTTWSGNFWDDTLKSVPEPSP